MLAAVRQYWRALVFATEELRADREFVLEVAKHGRDALVFAAVELRADREIVLEAVKRNGHALEFAAEELRADPEVVLEAVKQDRGAIVYAAEELRLATRVVQLVAESAGADVSVRCLSMGGEEVAVLRCGAVLTWTIWTRKRLSRCRIFWERFARGRRNAPMAVMREGRGGAPIHILLWAGADLPP